MPRLGKCPRHAASARFPHPMRRTRREKAIGAFPGQPNPKSAFWHQSAASPSCRTLTVASSAKNVSAPPYCRSPFVCNSTRTPFSFIVATPLSFSQSAGLYSGRRPNAQEARIPSTSSTSADRIEARASVLTRVLASAVATLPGSAGGSRQMLSTTLLGRLPRKGSVWRQRHSVRN